MYSVFDVQMLLLYGFDLRGLGNITPNSNAAEDTPYTHQSVVLRFAVASSFFLLITLAQVRAATLGGQQANVTNMIHKRSVLLCNAQRKSMCLHAK